MPIPDHMNEEQLTHYLTVMIEKMLLKLQQNRPDLKVSPQMRKDLAKDISKIMMQNGEFSREDIIDKNPKFIHKLTMTLVMAATLGKHENLFNSLKKLFSERGIEKNDDLKKKLTPGERRKIEKELKKIHEEMIKALEELNLIKLPKPTPGSVPAAKPEEEDKMINLFGILNSRVTGTMQVPVFVDWGNGNAIVDVNPASETSYAQIDEVNKIGDKEFGDPLSLNYTAEENYESMGGVISQVHSQYKHDMTLKPQLAMAH